MIWAFREWKSTLLMIWTFRASNCLLWPKVMILELERTFWGKPEFEDSDMDFEEISKSWLWRGKLAVQSFVKSSRAIMEFEEESWIERQKLGFDVEIWWLMDFSMNSSNFDFWKKIMEIFKVDLRTQTLKMLSKVSNFGSNINFDVKLMIWWLRMDFDGKVKKSITLRILTQSQTIIKPLPNDLKFGI
mgnify:CR=1 FL=1